ncbi:sigma-70 family RNA polymerase sigma factor, partial [Microcoleus sp.]|uniref:RNA polymerase sigma factor n=1 Tax=Microcoleus sp. TaxID=44472 RepID=UPI0035252967
MSSSQSVIAQDIWGGCEDIEKAFWQLWEQNRDYLYRCCVKWMGNTTDAEEVLSRAMLKAWDKLPDYAAQITNLRAWLIRLTHNLCIDIHRERRRKAMQIEDIEEIAATGNSAFISGLDSPEEALLHHELGKYIRRAMVESMGDIIPRTSQLDPDVLVSPHPAPDVLSFRLCSCGCNRG